VGVSAIVGAFYLGGRVTASANESAAAAMPMAAASAAPVATEATARPDELAVECEPGQRAVVRTSRDGATPQVACVSDPRPVMRQARTAYAPAVVGAPDAVRVSDTGDRPYARPAVITEPVEVYRPRSRPAAYETREVVRPRRTVKKSVAIIGGSTAAGAVVGGLVKGPKGAVIGGLLGGGAATVWDQVTRRQNDVR
jgi:hypothetical protein